MTLRSESEPFGRTVINSPDVARYKSAGMRMTVDLAARKTGVSCGVAGA
jgi:hypothetical protein